MRKKSFIFVGVIALVGIIALTTFFILRTSADGLLTTRTVDSRTVYEYQADADQILPTLSPDDSHSITLLNYQDRTDTGADYAGYLSNGFSNFQDWLNNPTGTQITPAYLTPSESNFTSDGATVVWAEIKVPQNENKKIRCYKISTQSYINIDTDSTAYKMYPGVSGNYVVYAKGSTATNKKIYLANINQTPINPSIINQTSYDQDRPIIKGSKVVWADKRNESQSGIDIYGYNISTQSSFTVTTSSGNQSIYKFNGRYVLYAGAVTYPSSSQDPDSCMAICAGLKLYDSVNDTTETITSADVHPEFFITGGDSPKIVWAERVENTNGTFWSTRYKSVGDQSCTTVSNTTTLNAHEQPLAATPTHIAYSRGADSCDLNPLYVYKFSNQTNYQMDNKSVNDVSMDNAYITWTVTVDDEEEDSTSDLAGSVLP
jgi:hypothetical protein